MPTPVYLQKNFNFRNSCKLRGFVPPKNHVPYSCFMKGIVASCPHYFSKWRLSEDCSDGSASWVYHPSSNTVYRNSHCAICNLGDELLRTSLNSFTKLSSVDVVEMLGVTEYKHELIVVDQSTEDCCRPIRDNQCNKISPAYSIRRSRRRNQNSDKIHLRSFCQIANATISKSLPLPLTSPATHQAPSLQDYKEWFLANRPKPVQHVFDSLENKYYDSRDESYESSYGSSYESEVLTDSFMFHGNLILCANRTLQDSNSSTTYMDLLLTSSGLSVSSLN